MPERPKGPIVIPAPVPGDSRSKNDPDRRAAPRFPLAAAAEVVDLRSQTRVAGRCSDLSPGGCYVDTLSPLAAGSPVRVHIQRGSAQFEAEAVVAYSQAPMGMGLSFTEIRPEYQAVLRSWIAELSGEAPANVQVPAKPLQPGTISEIENLRQVLNDLINLMVRKRILSEEERTVLLRQIFH